jgi:hypothetical protein
MASSAHGQPIEPFGVKFAEHPLAPEAILAAIRKRFTPH